MPTLPNEGHYFYNFFFILFRIKKKKKKKAKTKPLKRNTFNCLTQLKDNLLNKERLVFLLICIKSMLKYLSRLKSRNDNTH